MLNHKYFLFIFTISLTFILIVDNIPSTVKAAGTCSGTYQCCDSVYTDHWCSNNHSINCKTTDLDPCPIGAGECVEHTVCDGEDIVDCSGSTENSCESPSSCPKAGQSINGNSCSWTCTPTCPSNAACGDSDGCGGTCDGTCPAGQSCNASHTCEDIIQCDSSCRRTEAVEPPDSCGFNCQPTQRRTGIIKEYKKNLHTGVCDYTPAGHCSDISDVCENFCSCGASTDKYGQTCCDTQLAIPQSLNAIGINDSTHVKLTWNDVTTDVNGDDATSDVKGYILQISQDNANWNSTGDGSCDNVSGQDTVECTDIIQTGIPVYYRIAADGDCPADSDWSASIHYVPLACESLVISFPPDPGGNQLYIGSSANVTATVNSSNSGAPPLSYDFYSQDSQGTFNPASTSNDNNSTTYTVPNSPGTYTLYFNATDTNGARVWDSNALDTCKASYEAVYKNENQSPDPATVSCSYDKNSQDLTFSWSDYNSVVDHPTDSERVDPYEPAVGFCESNGVATGSLHISCSNEPYWWQVAKDGGSTIYDINGTSDYYRTDTVYHIDQARFNDLDIIRLDHHMKDARTNKSSNVSAYFHTLHDNQPPEPAQNLSAQYYNNDTINNSVRFHWEWTRDNTCDPVGNGSTNCSACEKVVNYCTTSGVSANDSSITCDPSKDGPFDIEVWDLGTSKDSGSDDAIVLENKSTNNTQIDVSCNDKTDHWLELRVKTRDARGNLEPKFSTIQALCNNTAPKCVSGINSGDNNFDNNNIVDISKDYGLTARGEDEENQDVYYRWTQSIGGGYTAINGVDSYQYNDQHTTWTSPSDEYSSIQLTFDVGDHKDSSDNPVYNGTSCVKMLTSCDLQFSSREVDQTSIRATQHTSDKITLVWNEVEYADEYQIDVKKGSGGSFNNVATVTDTTYTYNYSENDTYTFRITAKDTNPSPCSSNAQSTEYTVDKLVGSPPSCTSFTATYNSQVLQNDDIVPPNADIDLTANVTDPDNDDINYGWESSIGASFSNGPVSPNTEIIKAPYGSDIANTYTMPGCGQSPEIYLNLKDSNSATNTCAIRLQTNSCGTSMNVSLTDGTLSISDDFPVSVSPPEPVFEYTINGGTASDTGTAKIVDDGICADENYTDCHFDGYAKGQQISLPNNATTPDGSYNVIVSVTDASSPIVTGDYPLKVESTFAGVTYYSQSNISVTRSGGPFSCYITRSNEDSAVYVNQDVTFYSHVSGNKGTLTYTWTQDNTGVGYFTSPTPNNQNEDYHTQATGKSTITVNIHDNSLNSDTTCNYTLDVGNGTVYPGIGGQIWFDYNENDSMDSMGYIKRHEIPGSGWYKPIDDSGTVGYLFGCCFIHKISDNGTPGDTSDDFDYYDLVNCSSSDPYGTISCANPGVPFADISGANSAADNLILTTNSSLFGDQVYNEIDGGNNYYYSFRYDLGENYKVRVEVPGYDAFKLVVGRQTYNDKGKPDKLGHIFEGVNGNTKSSPPNVQDIPIGLVPVNNGEIFVETYKVDSCSDFIYDTTQRLGDVQIYLDSVDKGKTDLNGDLTINNVPINDSSAYTVTAISSTYVNCDSVDNSEDVQVTSSNISPTVKFKFIEKNENFIVLDQGNFSILNSYDASNMQSTDSVITHSGSLIANGNIDLGNGNLEDNNSDGKPDNENNVYDLPNYDNGASLDINSLFNSEALKTSDAVEYVDGDISTSSDFSSHVDSSGNLPSSKSILMVNGNLTIPFDVTTINALIITSGNVTISGNTTGGDLNLTVNGGLLVNGANGIVNDRKTRVYVKNDLNYLRNPGLKSVPITKIYVIKYE